MKRFSSVFTFLAAPACLMSAATAAETPESTMEEVVVTATRAGETSLQETPIAVTVLSEESLEQHGVENVRDLVRLTPGLNISQNTEFAHIYIRGVGSNNSFIGSDPSSTLYIDGVYIGRPMALFSDFLGVERVEVLRGPQGVLYGRNSTGGAINVINATPEDDDFYKVKVGAGSFNEQKLNLFGNIAINDGVAANLSLSRELRDGYVDNKGGDDLIDKDSRAARGAIRIAGSDEVEVILRADYMQRNETSTAYKSTLKVLDPTSAAESVIPGNAAGGQGEDIDDFFTVNATSPTFIDSIQKGASAEFNIQLSDSMTLTYLPAFRSSDISSAIDSDWTDIDHRATEIEENQDQFSHELRLLVEGSNYNLLFGAYQFHESVESDLTVNLLDGTTGYSRFDESLTTDTSAVFANGQVWVTSDTAVSLGLRSSKEYKEFNGAGRLVLDGILDITTPLDQKDNWSEVTPRFAVEHIVNDDIFVYGSVSEGFKSGGVNFSDGQTFEPEHIISYEIGAKTTWLDNALMVNTTVFHYTYDDLQVSAFEGASGTSPRVRILNAAEASVNGVEIEFSFEPSDMWDIKGSIAYLDAEYDTFITGRSAANTVTVEVDVSDNELNHAPALTANIDFGFHHALAQGQMNYLLSTYWQDQEYFTAFNDEITSQDAYGLVDVRIAYQAAGNAWEIAAFGHNVTDEEYSNASQDFALTGVALNIMPPATYGIEFTYQSF